jgi:hypothetical protein
VQKDVNFGGEHDHFGGIVMGVQQQHKSRLNPFFYFECHSEPFGYSCGNTDLFNLLSCNFEDFSGILTWSIYSTLRAENQPIVAGEISISI